MDGTLDWGVLIVWTANLKSFRTLLKPFKVVFRSLKMAGPWMLRESGSWCWEDSPNSLFMRKSSKWDWTHLRLGAGPWGCASNPRDAGWENVDDGRSEGWGGEDEGWGGGDEGWDGGDEGWGGGGEGECGRGEESCTGGEESCTGCEHGCGGGEDDGCGGGDCGGGEKTGGSGRGESGDSSCVCVQSMLSINVVVVGIGLFFEVSEEICNSSCDVLPDELQPSDEWSLFLFLGVREKPSSSESFWTFTSSSLTIFLENSS